MSIRCPRCNLYHPDSALRCECGYNFETGIEHQALRGRGAINWYLAALKKYAVFSGRAQRKEYWFFTLFNVLIVLALPFVEGFLGIASESDENLLGTLFVLAVAIPWTAVAVRRLHDTGRSGWWLFIGLVPLIGGIIGLIFMIQEGDVGQNAYGLNPKTAPVEDSPLGQ